MSAQTRGHEAEHELLNRQASALYASENHLSAFEYALIAHLFQEPACTPNVHTEALVNFACAYSQGVFDGVQLAKPDIEAKASRLLDTAESVLTHNVLFFPLEYLTRRMTQKRSKARSVEFAFYQLCPIHARQAADRQGKQCRSSVDLEAQGSQARRHTGQQRVASSRARHAGRTRQSNHQYNHAREY